MKFAWNQMQEEDCNIIADCVVVADQQHRQKIGLGMVGSGCTLLESLDDLDPEGQIKNRLGIIDSRIEAILNAIDIFLATSTIELLTIVAPLFVLDDLINQLQASESFDRGALEYLAIHDHYAIIRIVHDSEGTSSAEGFFRGLELGIETSSGLNWKDPRPNNKAGALRHELLSVLEAIDVVTFPPEAETPKKTTPQATNGQRAFEELERKLIVLQAEYDSLSRKYSALAGSALGRITLKRWQSKKRRSLS